MSIKVANAILDLLDESSKEKMEDVKRRYEQIYGGVRGSGMLPVTFSIGVGERRESVACSPKDIKLDEFEAKKLIDSVKKQIDQEIKEIFEISDPIADKLGIDRDMFFQLVI